MHVFEGPLLNAWLGDQPVFVYRYDSENCSSQLITATETIAAQLLNWEGLGLKLLGITSYGTDGKYTLRHRAAVYAAERGPLLKLDFESDVETDEFIRFKPPHIP